MFIGIMQAMWYIFLVFYFGTTLHKHTHIQKYTHIQLYTRVCSLCVPLKFATSHCASHMFHIPNCILCSPPTACRLSAHFQMINKYIYIYYIDNNVYKLIVAITSLISRARECESERRESHLIVFGHR